MKTKLIACAALLMAACCGSPSARKAAATKTEVKHGPEIVLAAPDTVGGTSVNALNLVYLADRTVYEGRNIPAEHVRYLCGQDAAGYAENVNLYTAGHGLRSITRGSVPEAELLAALGLEPARWFVALAQTVGK